MRRATKQRLVGLGQQVLPGLAYELTTMVLGALKTRRERPSGPPITEPVEGGDLEMLGAETL